MAGIQGFPQSDAGSFPEKAGMKRRGSLRDKSISSAPELDPKIQTIQTNVLQAEKLLKEWETALKKDSAGPVIAQCKAAYKTAYQRIQGTALLTWQIKSLDDQIRKHEGNISEKEKIKGVLESAVKTIDLLPKKAVELEIQENVLLYPEVHDAQDYLQAADAYLYQWETANLSGFQSEKAEKAKTAFEVSVQRPELMQKIDQKLKELQAKKIPEGEKNAFQAKLKDLQTRFETIKLRKELLDIIQNPFEAFSAQVTSKNIQARIDALTIEKSEAKSAEDKRKLEDRILKLKISLKFVDKPKERLKRAFLSDAEVLKQFDKQLPQQEKEVIKTKRISEIEAELQRKGLAKYKEMLTEIQANPFKDYFREVFAAKGYEPKNDLRYVALLFKEKKAAFSQLFPEGFPKGNVEKQMEYIQCEYEVASWLQGFLQILEMTTGLRTLKLSLLGEYQALKKIADQHIDICIVGIDKLLKPIEESKKDKDVVKATHLSEHRQKLQNWQNILYLSVETDENAIEKETHQTLEALSGTYAERIGTCLQEQQKRLKKIADLQQTKDEESVYSKHLNNEISSLFFLLKEVQTQKTLHKDDRKAFQSLELHETEITKRVQELEACLPTLQEFKPLFTKLRTAKELTVYKLKEEQLLSTKKLVEDARQKIGKDPYSLKKDVILNIVSGMIQSIEKELDPKEREQQAQKIVDAAKKLPLNNDNIALQYGKVLKLFQDLEKQKDPVQEKHVNELQQMLNQISLHDHFMTLTKAEESFKKKLFTKPSVSLLKAPSTPSMLAAMLSKEIAIALYHPDKDEKAKALNEVTTQIAFLNKYHLFPEVEQILKDQSQLYSDFENSLPRKK